MIRVIAEAGINHCGRVEDAIKLVNVAHSAGADVVKFQLYHTDKLVRDVENRDLLKSCELTVDEHARIKHHCDALDIEWMASCFDNNAVDLAVQLGAETIKVGSGEIINHQLIKRAAKAGKGVMLSTGMCNLDEIRDAFGVFVAFDALHPYGDISLLHCVCSYPCPFDEANLAAIKTLKLEFPIPVGFSDHTVGFEAAVAAVGIGAEIIERHIMLAPGCPDEAVSLSPENFRGYVATIRRTEQMMGDGVKKCMLCEEENRKNVRYRWHKAG